MTRRGALLIGLLGGCLPPPGTAEEPLADPSPGTPALTAFSMVCDPDVGRWELRAETDAWIGQARLWFTADFVYVERHAVKSAAAAEDGSADTLRLDLPFARDWRAVTEGTNTALVCGATPDGLFAITPYKASNVVDCRKFGPEPDRWLEVPDVPPCDQIWTPEEPEGTEGTDSEGTEGT